MALLGALTVAALTDLVPQFTAASDGEQLLVCAVCSGLLGVSVGVIQRYAVRRWANIALPWIAATGLGWVLAGTAWWLEYKVLGGARFTVGASAEPVVYVVTGLAGGLATGLGQWVAIRTLVPKSGWWIIITTLSWALGIMISWVTINILLQAIHEMATGYLTHNELFSLLADLGLVTITGLITGLLTGTGLSFLLQHAATSRAPVK